MPEFDPLIYRYASQRSVVYAKNAVCCTSVPLGAQIGLDTIRSGGNAVDAAVAMAGAMPLLEPTGNGLGADCFALVWIEREKKLYGLNASGVAPAALSAEKVRALGCKVMPEEGWLPTMVLGGAARALWHKAAGGAVCSRNRLCRGRISRAGERCAPVGARQRPHCGSYGKECRAARILVEVLYEARRYSLPRG